jgi:hypothetical protein
MAFAAMGAAEVLAFQPGHDQARRLLADAARAIGPPCEIPHWPWPEQRLSYANAAIPEVLLAAGAYLELPRLIDVGLTLLTWLRDTETRVDHLSVTPTGGWSADEPRPGFDQQPIEVAALADAFARAFAITGDASWTEGIRMCVAWFRGSNDLNHPMICPGTGGSCDGLGRIAPNWNQGAESTLALISTLQHERTHEAA